MKQVTANINGVPYRLHVMFDADGVPVIHRVNGKKCRRPAQAEWMLEYIED